MYYIWGGVWKNMKFEECVPGTEEVYGPFATYCETVKVWRGKMGLKIDTCEHRLFISRVA